MECFYCSGARAIRLGVPLRRSQRFLNLWLIASREVAVKERGENLYPGILYTPRGIACLEYHIQRRIFRFNFKP